MMVMASGGIAGAIGSVLIAMMIFAIVKASAFVIEKSVTKVHKNSILTQDIQDVPLKKRKFIGLLLLIVLILIIASPFIVIPFLVD